MHLGDHELAAMLTAAQAYFANLPDNAISALVSALPRTAKPSALSTEVSAADTLARGLFSAAVERVKNAKAVPATALRSLLELAEEVGQGPEQRSCIIALAHSAPEEAHKTMSFLLKKCTTQAALDELLGDKEFQELSEICAAFAEEKLSKGGTLNAYDMESAREIFQMRLQCGYLEPLKMLLVFGPFRDAMNVLVDFLAKLWSRVPTVPSARSAVVATITKKLDSASSSDISSEFWLMPSKLEWRGHGFSFLWLLALKNELGSTGLPEDEIERLKASIVLAICRSNLSLNRIQDLVETATVCFKTQLANSVAASILRFAVDQLSAIVAKGPPKEPEDFTIGTDLEDAVDSRVEEFLNCPLRQTEITRLKGGLTEGRILVKIFQNFSANSFKVHASVEGARTQTKLTLRKEYIGLPRKQEEYEGILKMIKEIKALLESEVKDSTVRLSAAGSGTGSAAADDTVEASIPSALASSSMDLSDDKGKITLLSKRKEQEDQESTESGFDLKKVKVEKNIKVEKK